MEQVQNAIPMMKIGSGGFLNQDDIIAQLGIRRGMIIADMGCGAGYFTIPMAKLLDNTGQVYAIDVLTAAIESVTSQAKLYGLLNVFKIRANVEVLGGTGIVEGRVDLALMVNLLFQCQDRDSVFEEAKRILAPGGRIAVIDWIPNSATPGPSFERCISEEEAKRVAMKNGLKVVQSLRTGESHYGFILELV